VTAPPNRAIDDAATAGDLNVPCLVLDLLSCLMRMIGRLLFSPDQRVGVIGISLGGAATVLTAPPLELDAAVFEAVYPSIDRAVVNRLSMRVGPLAPLPAPLLLLLMRPCTVSAYRN
jgi:hypothetical protein